VKTYTAPACGIESSFWFPLIPFVALASKYAVTAIVLPSALRLTTWPNSAPACGFDGLMYDCCVHGLVAFRRVNTYTAPAL
jgi:hypothetical protein